ncbi:hypothetical protein HXZ60_00835 [Acinetobacter towneri]|uniref:hypothetical protein n=1 Tax=Acinetobacter towneri TaxID=202956 RepID=UPI002574E2F8|nr:hypothetical protein [Acinetobacter towneri]MDM1282153.1 hypothetical protein [Acinetobacter towneri]
MIENLLVFISILTAELISLGVLRVLGCDMKGKYWYTLYFFLAFFILFLAACTLYFTFNPIDHDTLKQNQATDLIYIFTGISALLAPVVLIFSLDSWKESFNAEKHDLLLRTREEICSKIQQYILYNLSKHLYESKKNILEILKSYSDSMNISEFYSKIDTSYNFIIQDLSILSDNLHRNHLNLKSFEKEETLKLQSEIIKDVNSLIAPYADFKMQLWDSVNNNRVKDFIANFDSLQTWEILENINTRHEIILKISKLKRL